MDHESAIKYHYYNAPLGFLIMSSRLDMSSRLPWSNLTLILINFSLWDMVRCRKFLA